jgi:pimeloyl-ACP methyl ester carboxylesterase
MLFTFLYISILLFSWITIELRKLLPLLKRFHVVAPSIPGYGWSEAPREPGASAPWRFFTEKCGENSGRN